MKLLFAVFLLPFFIISAQTGQNQNSNPFFVEWETPFEAPPFDLIKTEHFKPAFIEAMKLNKEEINAIINNPEEPTFENTIVALEKSGQMINKVAGTFYHLSSANTNSELQQTYAEVAPLLSQHGDDINFNLKLFERIKILYNKKEKLNLNAEQKTLLDKSYRDFVKSGANLNDADKDKLRKMNEELSMLSLKFRDNLLKETNAFSIEISDEKDLAGLPENIIKSAKDDAERKGITDKWVFTLQQPSYIPFMTYSDKRDLREKMFKASTLRGNNDNENDNKDIVKQMVLLRLKKANLLGYKSHADFIQEEYMSKNPQAVYKFLMDLWEPAQKVAKEEAEELQKMAARDGANFKIQPWDWSYYAEKLKKEKYDLDEQMLRPYFKLENVIDGLLTVVNKLYGFQLVARNDIPVYHPDVKVFELKEADGKHIGIIYTDYFPRDSKRGGAWSSAFRSQSNIDGQFITPIIYNTGNFSKPTADSPALLTLDEVQTLFHEFGHALHGLLSNLTYPSLSGTNVAWDFVELPSQIMENWVTEPEVLRLFAKHYETGEIMPDELIAKVQNAQKFNQGFATVSYLTATLLDMDYHSLTEEKNIDVPQFEKELAERIGVLPEIGVRYRSTVFQHIFAGGYSAGYYSYIWAEVLDSDAFQACKEKGLFDKATAAAFRENILSKGGSDDPMNLYVNFRGKKPSVDALLQKRGLNTTSKN
jgi:peptidyl-dipeptidase Dcp